jgi:DNA-binding protein
MDKKVKEYIREEVKVIQQLQKAIDEMTIEERGNKSTKQICVYIALQAKLMTKTQEYLLAILSRINEIGDAEK